jgi:hypothetical protein
MHCHLFVPDFFRFSGAQDAGRLAAAETLIAKGRRAVLASESADAWLCRQFGVARQRDWPVAPYALIADGGAPGAHYWLRADPVHLLVDRDRLVLADGGAFAVSRAEAEALVESLNEHFRGRMLLYPMQPERWYARLEAAPDLETVPLPAARGTTIEPNLPRGGDGMRFHALMNEAQMLLFEHPVNAAREARGEPPVNSIWFWGGGVLSGKASSAFKQVLADDPLARGLARAAGIPAAPLPAHGRAWLARAPDEGVALIVLDGVEGADLERDWFAPLLDALRAGRIGMVTLHLTGPDARLDAETVRSDLRYFWRRRRPLASYAPSICHPERSEGSAFERQ